MGQKDDKAHRSIRVVELSTVTDQEIERVLNEMLEQGYELDNMHFAMREASRRPSMAFLVFYESYEPDSAADGSLHLVDRKPRDEED